MSSYKLCSLSFETTPSYNTNLETLLTLLTKTSDYSLIVAHEVCLTGFDYDNFENVCAFAAIARERIRKLSHNKIIILTLIEKRGNEVYNVAKVFHNEKLCYERAKAKLFRFGGEEKYFSEANENEVQIIEVDGLKIGILICFELRFKTLWQKLEGCDVIAIPSWWGALRALHFKTLTNALAIMNQCYVIASDAKNVECTGLSGIITPQGIEERNGNKPCLELEYDKKEISLMRRYMNVGIDG